MIWRFLKDIADAIMSATSPSQTLVRLFPNAPGAHRLNPLFVQLGLGRPALVVVDMQTKFLFDDNTGNLYNPEWQNLVDEVERLVVDAVAKGWKVFLLEFVGYGPTIPQIKQHIKDYPLAVTLRKDRRDGSEEVLSVNLRHANGSDTYRVCGVYAEQCVEETVSGLALRQPEAVVEVVPSACRPYEGAFIWEQFPRAANVRLANAA